MAGKGEGAMKAFASKRAVKTLVSIAVCGAAVCALFAVAGFLARGGAQMAWAAPDRYEVRARLLMQAMDSVGPATAQDAASLWATGLEKRSAALQYAALDAALRKEYAAAWEKTAPNWVTGVSSPWIGGFTIGKMDDAAPDRPAFALRFFTYTSAGAFKTYDATVVTAREGGFWRVVSISADKDLDAYMGRQD